MIGLAIFLVIFLFFILPAIILFSIAFDYVLFSFALWRMAKQTEIEKPAHAWIPVVRYQILGKCAQICHARTTNGQSTWNFGKILLILHAVYAGATVFLMPIAFIMMCFGFSLLWNAITWLAIALRVATAVCAFKIFRYCLEDPYDVIVSVLTTLYPGFVATALLICSFMSKGKNSLSVNAEFSETDAVIITAEQD